MNSLNRACAKFYDWRKTDFKRPQNAEIARAGETRHYRGLYNMAAGEKQHPRKPEALREKDGRFNIHPQVYCPPQLYAEAKIWKNAGSRVGCA